MSQSDASNGASLDARIDFSAYVNVYDQVDTLGLSLSSPLAILPRGFGHAASEKDLSHEAEASTLRKVLTARGVQVEQVQPKDHRLPSVLEHSSELVIPTLFIAGLVSQDALAVRLLIEVLQSWLLDAAKALLRPTVRLSIVVEQGKKRTFKKIEYEGPVRGLRILEGKIRELHD